eukprot:jgi/Tetstr1/433541/TSEL_022809.t1
MKLVGTSKFRVKPPAFSCDTNISDQVEHPLPNKSFNCLASMTNKAIKNHDKVYDELDYETLAGIYAKLEEAADDGERSLIVIDDQAAAMNYITVPLAIRKSVDYLTMFHFSNLKEFRALQDELVFLPPDKFDELVRFVFDKPHSELFVDILGNKFYKDFNLIDLD